LWSSFDTTLFSPFDPRSESQRVVQLSCDPFTEDADGEEDTTEDGTDVESEGGGGVDACCGVRSDEFVRLCGGDGEEGRVGREDVCEDEGLDVDVIWLG
jgi:hypothetical protein